MPGSGAAASGAGSSAPLPSKVSCGGVMTTTAGVAAAIRLNGIGRIEHHRDHVLSFPCAISAIAVNLTVSYRITYGK